MVATGAQGYTPRMPRSLSSELCSGFEAGSYSRLIDFLYHSTLGRVIEKKNKSLVSVVGFTETSQMPLQVLKTCKEGSLGDVPRS